MIKKLIWMKSDSMNKSQPKENKGSIMSIWKKKYSYNPASKKFKELGGTM